MHDALVRSGAWGWDGARSMGQGDESSCEVSTGRKGLLHAGGMVIPKGFGEQSQLQGSPFLCSDLMSVLIPGEDR